MADSGELHQLFCECMPLFIAMGDEVRLTIIETLTSAGLYDSNGQNVAENLDGYTPRGKHGLMVKEITDKTNLSRPAISHHLKILKNAGLVAVQKEGTSNYYYLTIDHGTERLCSLGNQLSQLLDHT